MRGLEGLGRAAGTPRGEAVALGGGVFRAARFRCHERRPGEPLHRSLRIFALDPTVSRIDGSVATVDVPYEPLGPGPVGCFLEVDPRDGHLGLDWSRVDLDRPENLLTDGRTPSPSDPHFHQQMVYAVASLLCWSFRRALGRNLAWGFDRPEEGPVRLRLRPHALEGRNAYYDKERGEICFGYYRASSQVAGRNVPEGHVFTCLSPDIVVHETTHALLDGLRAHFTFPAGPDTLAFHEGFADLMAVLQHLRYPLVVRRALARTRGDLAQARQLTDLALQFGETVMGEDRGLRTALGPGRGYDPSLEAHDLGSVLVAAVFEAFTTLFRRRTERLVRLATGGSGILPPGDLPHDLLEAMADQAVKTAGHFLNICIRAIDYCPPVDLEFGEYLRAVVTADTDLVPEDPLGYREAWVDAFRRRGIYPRGVTSLSEDALLWGRPELRDPLVPGLSFAELRFDGSPSRPSGPSELQRQAMALGHYVCRPENLEAFGLATPGEVPGTRDRLELPCVESIRTSSRVGPDGDLLFDQVAEVTQRRIVHSPAGSFEFYGGSTVILGPRGEVRYVIRKSVTNRARMERQREFMESDRGSAWWTVQEGGRTPRRELFRMLHQGP